MSNTDKEIADRVRQEYRELKEELAELIEEESEWTPEDRADVNKLNKEIWHLEELLGI
jgi:hypothetical protein